MALNRISTDPARMRGLPCVRGTRITVSAILGQLAAGRSVDEVLGDYPQLEREDVLAALEYAAAETGLSYAGVFDGPDDLGTRSEEHLSENCAADGGS